MWVQDTDTNTSYPVLAESVINSAGLSSSAIAKMVMKDKCPLDYQLAYVKGHYIGYKGTYKQFTSQPRLLYPAPEPGPSHYPNLFLCTDTFFRVGWPGDSSHGELGRKSKIWS